ncbi:MAG: response regulator transcription factor [Acidobacteria bacterium]|nr:response regulator transcription factor [Acidobacteriota bacterium]
MNMRLISGCQAGGMGGMSIRVAIIDDDRALLDSLSRIIDAADGFRCAGAFPCVEEALPALRTAGVDVLLLDIQLPGVQGDQALEALRAVRPSMRILMLTVFSDRDRLFTCICNGAHGYLLKSTPPAKLLDAIRAARDGGSPFSPEIARHIVSLFQKTGPSSPLTSQEHRLLGWLAEGYSYQAAADKMNVSVNTVRNYVRGIYDKLHVHSKSAAVSKALRQGIIG